MLFKESQILKSVELSIYLFYEYPRVQLFFLNYHFFRYIFLSHRSTNLDFLQFFIILKKIFSGISENSALVHWTEFTWIVFKLTSAYLNLVRRLGKLFFVLYLNISLKFLCVRVRVYRLVNLLVKPDLCAKVSK